MSDSIDQKIGPLVYALNAWEGVETFSSCEGHNEGKGAFPFVCFTCAFETIKDISKRLLDTRWKIIFDDMASSKESHEIAYTLRYVPTEIMLPLEEIQGQIPGIVSRLSLTTRPPGRKPYIEDNFPAIICPNCGSETFDILFGVNAVLNYNVSNYPEIKADKIAWPPGPKQMSVTCEECEREIDDPEDIEGLYQIILRRLMRQAWE